jgi:uncharacterized membrane protein required for colicin V production
MITLASFFPTNGETVKWDYFTIGYAVILLLCIILGGKKGFLLMLFSLLGVILAGLGAYLLCKPVGGWAQTINNWGATVNNNIFNYLSGKLTNGSSQAAFNAVVDRATAEPYLTDDFFKEMGIPSIFYTYVRNFCLAAIPVSDPTFSVGYYIAQSATNYFFIGASFLVLFILFLIVVGIGKHFAKKATKSKVLGPVDHTIGAILGLVIGALYVIIISYGLSSVSGLITNFYAYLDKTLYLSDSTVWTVSKSLFVNNYFNVLLGFIK